MMLISLCSLEGMLEWLQCLKKNKQLGSLWYSDFSTLKAKGLDVYDKHVVQLYILMEFFFFSKMKEYFDLMSLPPLPFIVIWSFM